MNIKNSPKTAKKATIAFKAEVFLRLRGQDNDIRFESSPKGVLHPTETISIISSILLKKSFFEYWQKIDFFQLFPHFHKDFSKDLLSNLVKSTCFVGSIFTVMPQSLQMCDMINKFRNKLYSQRLVNNQSTSVC